MKKKQSSKTKDKHKRPHYPWDRWFSQTRIRLVRGKHFHCQPHAMAGQIRNRASKEQMSVNITIDEDIIIARFGR